MYDVIIIGAGHNGLAAAVHLAASGKKVLVIEAKSEPGGAVKTRELTLPGYRHDVCAMNLSLFAGSGFFRAHKDRLVANGTEFIHAEHGFASVFPDGDCIGVSRSLDTTVASIATASPADAQAWRKLVEQFNVDAPHLRALMNAPMPSLRTFKAIVEAWRKRGLGWLFEAYKLLVATPRDFLDHHFEHPKVKAMLAVWGLHLDFPPDTAGGALFCYFQTLAAQQFGVIIGKGGADSIVNGMVKTLQDLGGEILLGDPVTKILLTADDKARGVRLTSGQEFLARKIVANVHPQLVFGKLVDPSASRAKYQDAVAKFRPGPSTMMIHLALDGPVPWRAAAARNFAYVHVAPDMQMMTRVYAEYASNLLPAEPVLVVGQPSLLDATRTPQGKHALWLQVRMLPAKIEGDAAGEITSTDWAAASEPYAQRALALLERYAPGVNRSILGRTVVSPLDLEAENANLIGGDNISGSHHLDQNFFARPVPGWSRYSTPVRNLYLCGASTWPGSGTNAASGFMLAQKLAR